MSSHPFILRSQGLLLLISLMSAPAWPAFASDTPQWKTYRDAVSAFDKGDAAVRAEAFDWMRSHMGGFSVWDISQAFHAYCSMANVESPDTDIVAFYEEIAPGHPDDWRASLAYAVADECAQKGDHAKALALLQGFLGESTGISSEQRAGIVSRCAGWLAGPLGRPQDADGLLVAERKALPSSAVAAASQLDAVRAGIFADTLGQANEAESLWRSVLDCGASVHERDFASAADRLSAMLRDRGDKDGAMVVLLKLLGHPSLPPAWFAERLLALAPSPDTLARTVDALRGRMAVIPSSEQSYRSSAERLQPQIATILLALGRKDEALAECRVSLQLASDRGYESATLAAARILKNVDGSLGRANALLAFASESPPSPHGENPLLSVPAAADPIRTAFAEQLSSQPDSPDWRVHLSCSLSWLWLDRPDESMRSAVRAFALCPLETNALQQCAAAATRPFLIATHDEAAVQPLLDYLLFGSAGADGIPGTADDLPNPLPTMTARITPSAKTE